MQLLPAEFTSGDFLFNLLHRAGMVAVLAKRKPRHLRPTFETVIVQVHPARHIFGRDLPEREVMPSNESWGTSGWSYSDLVRAEARFDQLCHVQRKGHSPFKRLVASASQDSSALLAATNKLNPQASRE